MKNLHTTTRLMRFNRAQDGQALVLTGLGLLVLMLMAGLGVDVGYLRYEKQQMQKAADAGALAAASASIYGNKWRVAGQNDAAANGFKDGTNGISVTVNNPPATAGDPFAGNNEYYEVIVAQSQPTFFMRVGGFNTVNVSSRAVASAYGAASGCIYVMDPTDQDTYTATGSGSNVRVSSDCGIFVDSNNSPATGGKGDFKDNGGACTVVNGGTIALVGGVDVDACSTPPQGSISTGVAPFSDPLFYLQPPTVGACTYTNFPQINKNTTLQPGVYCGGISVSGGNAVTVTLNPGLYVLDGGGFKMSGGGSLNGDSVMIYNTGTSSGTTKYGTIDIEGISNSTLTASATNQSDGRLAGILFFDDRNASTYVNNPVNIITGQSGANITGALYFPSTSLQYSGGTAQSAYTIVVAWQFSLTGNSQFHDDYSGLPGGSPLRSAYLAE